MSDALRGQAKKETASVPQTREFPCLFRVDPPKITALYSSAWRRKLLSRKIQKNFERIGPMTLWDEFGTR